MLESQDEPKKVLIPVGRLSMSMDPGLANIWEIEIRVTTKSAIKEYKGGKLFKLDLIDNLHLDDPNMVKHNQIECTSFKETIEKYYPLF
jgi:hypothetical protein